MKTTIDNSFEDFKSTLNNNHKLQQEFRDNPIQAVNSIEVKNPKETDVWIYRLVVLTFGFAVVVIISGLIALALNNIQVKNEFITIFTAISSGAIGALAGLLAPSPNK
jgi:pheromone shutdown protein TraB